MNWSVATWNTLQLFSGDPKKFIEFHQSIGAKAICIKIGNGLRPWAGLQPFIDAAHDADLKAWGWWFLYGYNGEEQIIGEHAELLGVDGVALDVETQWESRAGLTNGARRNKALSLMKILRSCFSGQLALCSWWKPDIHPKTPVDVFLKYCDWNMPQHYWIGRYSNEGAVSVVTQSLELYGRMANWPASKTIPVLASYGQKYTTKGKEYWWKATVTQMKAAHEAAMAHGCPGVNWWSLDYLMGGAGHEAPQVVETAFIETIRDFAPSTPTPPMPPVPKPIVDVVHPSDVEIRVTEK